MTHSNEMTRRERMLAAIQGKPADKIPFWIMLEPHATLKLANQVRRPNRRWLRNLCRFMDRLPALLPTEELRDGAGLMAYGFQPEYVLDLGADAVEFFWGVPWRWLKGISIKDGKLRLKDMYGMVWGLGGLYLDVVDTPCKTPEDLDRYEFPDISHPSNYLPIRALRRLHPDVCVMALVPGVQDWSGNFLGMQRLYETAALRPDVIKRFFNKLADHSIQIIKGIVEAGADVAMITDDYGMQGRLMMSEKMWLELTYPCLRRQIDAVHGLGRKALLHSCGYQMPLLKHYAAAGLDALHAFQLGAGNDLRTAVDEVGGRLCFCTGIDVQRIGRMTPDQARRDILNAVKILAPTNRFVLATTNFLQSDTPVDVLQSILRAVEDVRTGAAVL